MTSSFDVAMQPPPTKIVSSHFNSEFVTEKDWRNTISTRYFLARGAFGCRVERRLPLDESLPVIYHFFFLKISPR
ncbi:hypothetical protein NXS19_005717 [Fusarium pseudograminearum]|nr:hypothetical protein NXS19_005717 [Fusarium pseudograminearum]